MEIGPGETDRNLTLARGPAGVNMAQPVGPAGWRVTCSILAGCTRRWGERVAAAVLEVGSLLPLCKATARRRPPPARRSFVVSWVGFSHAGTRAQRNPTFHSIRNQAPITHAQHRYLAQGSLRKAVITEHITVIPQLLDDGGGIHSSALLPSLLPFLPSPPRPRK